MLSNKQVEILKFGYTDYDALICDGAIRSGKTSVMSLAFVLWGMANFDRCNFIISGKTTSTVTKNVVKPLLSTKYLTDNFEIRYTKIEGLITVQRGNKINYFYVYAGNDESSYTKIQGLTAAGALFDEVVLMPRSFVNQALARCSVEGSKYWFSCNPDSPGHWFYKEWIKKAEEKKTKYIHFKMEDNPSLSEETLEKYKRMYLGVFHDRYVRGLWVTAEGIIYRRFAENKSTYVLNKMPDDIMFLEVGVDFGGNKSKTVFVCTGFTSNMEKVVVLECKRIDREISPEELDIEFIEFCELVLTKYKKSFYAKCDNAEPVLIRGLKNAVARAGLDVLIKNARKSEILSRIQLVSKLQGLNRFFVMDYCTAVIDALSMAVWDTKNPNTRLDDGTTDIDTLDALEYSIEAYMKDLI